MQKFGLERKISLAHLMPLNFVEPHFHHEPGLPGEDAVVSHRHEALENAAFRRASSTVIVQRACRCHVAPCVVCVLGLSQLVCGYGCGCGCVCVCACVRVCVCVCDAQIIQIKLKLRGSTT